MAHTTSIRWGRAIAGGLLAELVILVLVLPFAFVLTSKPAIDRIAARVS